MRTSNQKTSRLSIEVFNPQLLKETDLWSFDDQPSFSEEESDEQDDPTRFDELSLEEFQRTL